MVDGSSHMLCRSSAWMKPKLTIFHHHSGLPSPSAVSLLVLDCLYPSDGITAHSLTAHSHVLKTSPSCYKDQLSAAVVC